MIKQKIKEENLTEIEIDGICNKYDVLDFDDIKDLKNNL